MNSPIEDKILELIFKDKVITKILVDTLLPKLVWSPEALRDYTPENAYTIARENLEINLNKLLRDKL